MAGTTLPHQLLLQQLRRTRPGLLRVLMALRNLTTIGGILHLAIPACLVVQAVSIDLYLYEFIGWETVPLVAFDVLLCLHMLWFWREESGERAGAWQWFAYSWLRGAKELALFCKVMPELKLASATDGCTYMDLFVSLGGACSQRGTKSHLINVLYLTPFLYMLLMIRAGKAIFPALRYNRMGVDRYMLLDMLWHTMIDMIDQVDMFNFARLSELVDEKTRQEHADALVTLQIVAPGILFLGVVMQGQAFPYTLSDRWDLSSLAEGAAISPLAEASTGEPRMVRSATTEASGSYELTERPTRRRTNSSIPVLLSTSSFRHTYSGGSFLSTEGSPQSIGELERLRRRKLQAIQRQHESYSLISAHKRSAVVSIFLVDLPFLLVRLALFSMQVQSEDVVNGQELSGNSEESNRLSDDGRFPYFAVKNLAFIALNTLQYSLVSIISRNSVRDIERQIAVYSVQFGQPAYKREGDITPSRRRLSHQSTDSLAVGLGTGAVTPIISHGWHSAVQEAEQRVRQGFVRSSGVCGQVWLLLLGISFGLNITGHIAAPLSREPGRGMQSFINGSGVFNRNSSIR